MSALQLGRLLRVAQDAEGKDAEAREGGSIDRDNKGSSVGAAEADAVQPVSWASFWTDAKVGGGLRPPFAEWP